MSRLVIAASASADQAVILEYLKAKAGPRTAEKFRLLFRTVLRRLIAYPASGALRPAVGRDIRIGIVAPYLIIYRFDEGADVVTVLRMVDGRRRVSGRLLKSSG